MKAVHRQPLGRWPSGLASETPTLLRDPVTTGKARGRARVPWPVLPITSGPGLPFELAVREEQALIGDGVVAVVIAYPHFEAGRPNLEERHGYRAGLPQTFPTATLLTHVCKHVSAGHRLVAHCLQARPKPANRDTLSGYMEKGLCLHNRRSEALFGLVAGAGFEPAKEYSDGFTDLSHPPRDLHACARARCFPRHSPRTLVVSRPQPVVNGQAAKRQGLPGWAPEHLPRCPWRATPCERPSR